MLRLCKEVVGPAVEHHAADWLQRHELLRDQLRRVEMIERKPCCILFREELHREFPLGKVARFDGFEHVAPVIVGIGASELHRFVPHGGLNAQLGPPVKLDEGRVTFVVHQSKAVNAEPLDHPQRPRQGAIGHDPHHHVHGLRRQRDVVPERIVRGCRLRESAIGFHLHGMDEIGEFDRVLDEEHRDVVADQVPVAFLRIQLDGEAAHVARRVHRSCTARDGGEACEHRRAFAHLGQYLRRCELGQRVGELEESVYGGSARVDDAFRDAFVIEVRDLLAENEVFEQRRSARICFQRVLVVRDRRALIGRQGRVAVADDLMKFAAGRNRFSWTRRRLRFGAARLGRS